MKRAWTGTGHVSADAKREAKGETRISGRVMASCPRQSDPGRCDLCTTDENADLKFQFFHGLCDNEEGQV